MIKHEKKATSKATKVANDCERIMRIYSGMYYRTTNEANRENKYWVGKGIKICNEWLDNPLNFYLWSINNGYEEGLTIDRIDSNKDYEPSNCRWVSKCDNSGNTTHKRTQYVTYKGITYYVGEVKDIFGINGVTVRERLKRGWDEERAFNEMPKKMGRKYSKSYINTHN